MLAFHNVTKIDILLVGVISDPIVFFFAPDLVELDGQLFGVMDLFSVHVYRERV